MFEPLINAFDEIINAASGRLNSLPPTESHLRSEYNDISALISHAAHLKKSFQLDESKRSKSSLRSSWSMIYRYREASWLKPILQRHRSALAEFLKYAADSEQR